MLVGLQALLLYPTSIPTIFVNMLFEQLKPHVFGVDLFKAIKKDTFIEFDIRHLLKQLGNHKLPDSLIQFMLDFEPFFDHICMDVRLKQTSINLLHQKTEDISKEWGLNEVS